MSETVQRETYKLDRLRREIQASEGWRLTRKIDALNSTFEIFMGNYGELKRALIAFRDQQVPESILSNNRDDVNRYLVEVIRLLHNYLAAAMTLVDHTRIFSRELYERRAFLKKYDSEVKRRFVNSAPAVFIQNLRNYALHKKLPVTLAEFTLRDEEKVMESSIKLSIEDLRNWNKWPRPAAEFLANLDKDVDLDYFIEPYTKSVVEFHLWLRERQEAIHRQAFQHLEELQEEMRKVLAGAAMG